MFMFMLIELNVIKMEILKILNHLLKLTLGFIGI